MTPFHWIAIAIVIGAAIVDAVINNDETKQHKLEKDVDDLAEKKERDALIAKGKEKEKADAIQKEKDAITAQEKIDAEKKEKADAKQKEKEADELAKKEIPAVEGGQVDE